VIMVLPQSMKGFDSKITDGQSVKMGESLGQP
jgi:hypothetical protein